MANENLEWQSRSAFFEAPFLSDEEDRYRHNFLIIVKFVKVDCKLQ